MTSQYMKSFPATARAEPLPPPWSRDYRFKPVSQFLQHESAGNILKLALLTLTVYPLLELWAAFRIWPLQLVQLLNRLGFFKNRMRHLLKRARQVHLDTRNGWS